MATILPIAYNTGSLIDGTEQIGDLAIGTTAQDYSSNIGGVKWWASPDLDLQYVIGYADLSGTHPNPISFIPCNIGFWGSGGLTENSFINLCNFQFNETFASGNDVKVWLNSNGYWTNFGMGTTPSPTSTPTLTPAPTSTPTATPTPEPTSTPEPTNTPTPTPEPTSTPTPTTTGDLGGNLLQENGDSLLQENDDNILLESTLTTPTPTPTSTPEPTSTPTPTPTETPEMASLDIDIVMGYNGISFDGVTYTSDTTINVVKNQQYSIIAFNGSGLFQNWEGTNVNLPVPNSSNTIVTITGDTATLKAVFPEMTPTPTPTATSTPTPTPTDTPTPTPTATEVPPTETPTPTPTLTSTPTPTPTSTTDPNTFNVTNDGSSNYLINGQSDPTLTLTEGQTYTFNVNATGHPFWIKTVSSTGTGNTYNSGVTNNGTDSGTITFVVPYDAPSTLYYNCQFHSSMAGIINITDVPSTATPTPTPTATEVPPTETPTPTPTPTSIGGGIGEWYFYSDEGGIFDADPPVSDGNSIFLIRNNQTNEVTETFNPNKSDGVNEIYFNLNDSSGTNYTTQFTELATNGGTISITQGANTVTYTSTTPGAFFVESGGGFFLIQTGPSTQTVTSANPFVFGDPISLSFS